MADGCGERNLSKQGDATKDSVWHYKAINHALRLKMELNKSRKDNASPRLGLRETCKWIIGYRFCQELVASYAKGVLQDIGIAVGNKLAMNAVKSISGKALIDIKK